VNGRHAETNAILERIVQIHDVWTVFVQQPASRLLIWLVAENEASLIDAFVGQECDAATAKTPDVFVQLQAPFAGAGYGHALAHELVSNYSQLTDLAGPRWRAPKWSASEDDVQALLRVLRSFHAHHIAAESDSKLAIWLDPSAIGSLDAYVPWLHRLAVDAPTVLRFMVVADRAASQYEKLSNVAHDQVRIERCGFALPQALEELARNAGRSDPGAQFRCLQVQLATRLAEGQLKQVAALGAAAIQLAESHGWPQLAATTQLMLASAYASASRRHRALTAYAEVERLGSLDGSAVGTRLRLQARFGQGALLIAEQAWELAAVAYEAALTLAEQLGDTALAVDACRLASFCRTELGQPDAAWALGARGLKLGVGLDESARRSSTVPYLARQLVTLTQRHRAYAAQRRPLNDQLVKLFGVDWAAALPATKAN
jgi:hypothetical protein